jgi:hypothetical protein
MRRVILFLLTLLLASGTVAGSLAHATEDRAEASLFVAVIEAGCVPAPAIEGAEVDKKKSSPGEKQQVPAAVTIRASRRNRCRQRPKRLPLKRIRAS